MINLYFGQKLDAAQMKRLSDTLEGQAGRPRLNITPAQVERTFEFSFYFSSHFLLQVEQACAEHDDLESFFDALDKMCAIEEPAQGGGVVVTVHPDV